MDNVQIIDTEIAAEVQTEEKQQTDVVFTPKPVYDFFKRAFGVVCSWAALIVLSPLILIITVLILIKDFGNPFYTQDRVGKKQKSF